MHKFYCVPNGHMLELCLVGIWKGFSDFVVNFGSSATRCVRWFRRERPEVERIEDAPVPGSVMSIVDFGDVDVLVFIAVPSAGSALGVPA